MKQQPDMKYEINQFFLELDRKLAGDSFILSLGPADRFRQLLENYVEDYEYFYELYKEIEELKEKLDDIHNNIDIAIDNIADCVDSIEDENDKDIVERNTQRIQKQLKELWSLT